MIAKIGIFPIAKIFRIAKISPFLKRTNLLLCVSSIIFIGNFINNFNKLNILKSVLKVPSSLLLILIFGFSQIVHAHTFESNIPDLGQGGNWVVDTAQEKIMGNVMLQQINQSDLIVRDPIINDYLHHIALRFQPFVPKNDHRLNFFCVDNPVLNAFAFFGGNIAVHSGLILATETESELAAVLAHETAHIVQHHLARILTTNKKMMPLTIAQVLGALAIGALGSPEAGMHLASAALGGHLQNLINYTRSHEQEADRMGIQILAKAGFNPHAMPAVFEKMSKKSKYQTRPPEYLLTHPMFEERIADSTNRANKLPSQAIPDSLEFQLIRARLATSLQENSKKRVQRFREQLKYAANNPLLQDKDATAVEYAYALALSKNRQFEEAEIKMKELARRHPDQWIFELSMAEIAHERGEQQKTIEYLKILYEQHPNHYPISFYYVEALLDIKKASDAYAILEKFKKSQAEDVNFLELLGRTYSLMGNKVELHSTRAEWHYLRGEHKEALKQLDLALAKTAKSGPKASQIIQRKQAMEDMLKQQKKLM